MKNQGMINEIKNFAKPINSRFIPLMQKIKDLTKKIEVNIPKTWVSPLSKTTFVNKKIALNVQSLVNLAGETQVISFVEKLILATVFFEGEKIEIQIPAGINDINTSDPTDDLAELSKALPDFTFEYLHNGSNSIYLIVALEIEGPDYKSIAI
ncbi:MAG: hypothetical protein NTX85_01065 [Candidatus Nomurabacteria bacterium]|nr:hypothetical protein [Candidatus Nomurabacteria bacterium]